MADWADLLIIDVKHWDREAHIEWTGVSDEWPFQNLKTAAALGKDVLPRIPVIPGVNDSLKDAEGFSRKLKTAGVLKVQLLPFHQFGENKYTELGYGYGFSGRKALHSEELEDYRQAFLSAGIEAFF